MSKGVITAKKVGIVKITAVIGSKTCECYVRVVDTANKKGFNSFNSKLDKSSYAYAIETGDVSSLSSTQKTNLEYYGYDLESFSTPLLKQSSTSNTFYIFINTSEISQNNAFAIFRSVIPASKFTYSQSGSGYTRYEITLNYYSTDEQTKAEKIVKSLKLSGLSDYEKLKEIHDWIILNTAYDYDNYLKGTIPDISYTASGVFDKGVAVCDGYSKAFMLMARACGIECYKVSGYTNGGNHAWNVVKLEGKWYWIDVTWDDPVPDKKGCVSYDFFLLSDETLRSKQHNWECSIKCTDSSYEGKAALDEYLPYLCTTEDEVLSSLKAQEAAGQSELYVLYNKNGNVDESTVLNAMLGHYRRFYSPVELRDGYYYMVVLAN